MCLTAHISTHQLIKFLPTSVNEKAIVAIVADYVQEVP